LRVGKLLPMTAAVIMMATLLAACGGSEVGQTPPDEPIAPKTPSGRQDPFSDPNAPADDTLTVTVPKMQRIKESTFPNTHGEDEESLKNFAGIHLEGTGYPWQDEANVYLAGHRLGFPNTASFLAFWDIDNVEEGDQVFVWDANGREYTYEVFRTLEVGPSELFVTEPLVGKNILTLQSCTLPDYARRLVVQAELIPS
jgi:sortase A